jgi:hypothetical protein
MKYKFLTRRVTLLVFGDKNDTNYTGSCQVTIVGNKGIIDTMIGGDLYKLFLEEGLGCFKELGLVEIEACVTPAHLRLLKRYLSDKLNIEETAGIFETGGIALIWVSIKEK